MNILPINYCKHSALLFAMTISVVFGPLTQVSAQPYYEIEDLGVLDGQFSSAYAINETGLIAGEALFDTGPALVQRAVHYTAAGVEDLGAVDEVSIALGLNDLGTTVGFSFVGSNFVATMWNSSGALSQLPDLPGGMNASARAVNNAGIIVGSGRDSANDRLPIVWTAGIPAALPLLAGPGSLLGSAWDINDNDIVVGESSGRATQWEAGIPTQLILPTGFTSSFASAINELDQVTGFIFGSGQSNTAAIWHAVDDIELLPALTGFSEMNTLDINDNAEVVGRAFNPGVIGSEGFYYHVDVGTLNLYEQIVVGGSMWERVNPEAINNNGVIVGTGVRTSGQNRAFRLTPVEAGVRGDANGDRTLDISDAVYLLAHVFSGGPAPEPEFTGDANDDEVLDIADAAYILSYLFNAGDEPDAPFPEVGIDPTP